MNNYLARTWSPTTGCLQSQENVIDITKIEDLNQWPMVYLALFIEYPTPFIREYFEKIQRLTYPKQRIGILVHNQVFYKIEKKGHPFNRTCSFRLDGVS